MKFLKKIANSLFNDNVSQVAVMSDSLSSLSTADVILHIGAPKTGSSAIQNYFHLNSREIEQYGFYYPEHSLDENGVSGGHGEIGSLVINNRIEDARALFLRNLEVAKKKKCRLLLSAESFFIMPGEIRSILPDCTVHVVAFFRHPMEAFKSHYNQGVKRHFSTGHIREVAQGIERSRPGISGEVLLEWADLFGTGSISLIPYSDSSHTGIDTPSVMCNLLGIPFKGAGSNKINRSYTPCALEFKRLLNNVLDWREPRLNSYLDLLLQKYSDSLNPPGPSVRQMVGDDVFDDMKAYYDPIISSIESRFSVVLPFSESGSFGSDYESDSLLIDFISKDVEIFNYLRRALRSAIHNGKKNYSTLRLAELLGMPLDDFEFSGSLAGLSAAEVELAIGRNAEHADTLREFAKLLERSGQFEKALLFARRALELRPTGPYLKIMVERLENQTNSTGKNSDG